MIQQPVFIFVACSYPCWAESPAGATVRPDEHPSEVPMQFGKGTDHFLRPDVDPDTTFPTGDHEVAGDLKSKQPLSHDSKDGEFLHNPKSKQPLLDDSRDYVRQATYAMQSLREMIGRRQAREAIANLSDCDNSTKELQPLPPVSRLQLPKLSLLKSAGNLWPSNHAKTGYPNWGTVFSCAIIALIASVSIFSSMIASKMIGTTTEECWMQGETWLRGRPHRQRSKKARMNEILPEAVAPIQRFIQESVRREEKREEEDPERPSQSCDTVESGDQKDGSASGEDPGLKRLLRDEMKKALRPSRQDEQPEPVQNTVDEAQTGGSLIATEEKHGGREEANLHLEDPGVIELTAYVDGAYKGAKHKPVTHEV